MHPAMEILKAPKDKINLSWFQEISELLLNNTHLMIAGKPHRFLEIEYYYNGSEHLDPFAHCDPLQQTCGQWYFHRDEGSYRGGSFKGLDISFGKEGDFGGILIRTLETLEGEQVNGCSLCVDHILKQTDFEKIAELDQNIAVRKVWDQSSPLHIKWIEGMQSKDITETARVGLTLKRMYKNPTMPEFIMSNYRHLTEVSIKKGKIHTIISLHKSGLEEEEIRTKTRSTRKSVSNHIKAFQQGRELENFNKFRGKSLKTADLGSLHGVWHQHYEANRE